MALIENQNIDRIIHMNIIAKKKENTYNPINITTLIMLKDNQQEKLQQELSERKRLNEYWYMRKNKSNKR